MTSGPATNVLMDVDTGVDDAMALALAVASPSIRLIGVTTVAGNIPCEGATRNTLRVLDFLGATDVPVYKGMSRPLTREHFDAAHFHGKDGIGGASIPDSSRQPESMTAPEFIVQTARKFQGAVSFVFVGPLTNLAVALALEPDLARMVPETVIMGGAFDVPGNATPLAEFNIAVDPEAANAVMESDLNVTWIGLDVTRSANLYRADWDRVSRDDEPGALLVKEVYRHSFETRGLEEVHLHDPLALGTVLDRAIVECRQTAVSVDTSYRETAGKTRMVTDSQSRQQNVAIHVDSGAFRQLFGKLLGIRITA